MAETNGLDLRERHLSTQHIMAYFQYGHLPPHLQAVAEVMSHTAAAMVLAIDDGPELTAGLRKLLEAKDCFVRAAL